MICILYKSPNINKIEWFESILLIILGKKQTCYLYGAMVKPEKSDSGYQASLSENFLVMS